MGLVEEFVLSLSVTFSSAAWRKTCSSHLIVGGDHTHGHPVGVSADTEGVTAAVCYCGYIFLIAKSEGMEAGSRQKNNSNEW